MLKTIKVFFHRHEADLAQGLLRNSDLQSFVSGDDTAGFDLSLGTGNFKLSVLEKDVKTAQEILSSQENQADEVAAEQLNDLKDTRKRRFKVFVCCLLIAVMLAPFLAPLFVQIIGLGGTEVSTQPLEPQTNSGGTDGP